MPGRANHTVQFPTDLTGWPCRQAAERLQAFLLAALPVAACLAGAPATAQPGPTASQQAGLEDILVTARRRAENLQTVPAAVSVIGGDLLEASYTVNTQQLSLLVPTLYYNSANPRNTAFTIRGLGSSTLSISAANDGIEPGVGFYVDQVYHGRPATAAFDFTDIARVEVLRGPQGTLFGKNTTAGAIHVISREPSQEPEADAELSLGSYGFLQGRAALAGPLPGAGLAGRLSLQLSQRDGLLHNVRSGQELNSLYNLAVRGQLLFAPGDALRLRLIADVATLDAICCVQNYLRTGTSLRSPARQFPALAAGLGYVPPSTDVYARRSDVDIEPMIDTEDGGVSLIGELRLQAATLTSVSAWRYWDWDVANDRDFTGLQIQRVQRIPSRQDQYSQEFRLESNREGALHHVAGLYWFQQEIGGHPRSVYGADATYWLLNQANFAVPLPRNLLDGYGQTGESAFALRSHAVFGEVDYAATPRLTATLGVRYTDEDRQGRYATTVFGGADLTALAPATAAELDRAKLSILRPQDYTAADAGGSTSGRANLAFAARPTLLAYAGYAHGYKSGGLNMAGLPLDAGNRPALATAIIDDERHTTLELGLKSTLRGGAATLNVAAYRTLVEDYQSNVVSNLETAALRSYPANIPEVRVQGVEVDFTALLRSGLLLRAAAAFADGRNIDYREGPCPLELQTAATLACDLGGKPLPGLSRWSGTLGLDYTRRLGRGELVLHADTSLRSRHNNDTSASQYTWIAGYGVTNASLGYRAATGWELAVFVRNLFNADYLTALTIQTGNSGLILGQPSDPRLLGFTLRQRWR